MDFLKLVTKYINYDIDSLCLMRGLKEIERSDYEDSELEFIDSLYTIVDYVTDKYRKETISVEELLEINKSLEHDTLVNKLKDYRQNKIKAENINKTKTIINSNKAFESKNTHDTIMYYLLTNKIISSYINNLDVDDKLELIEKDYHYAYSIVDKDELDEAISICCDDNNKELLTDLFFLYIKICDDFSKEIIDYFISISDEVYLGTILAMYYLMTRNDRDTNIIKMYISTKKEDLANKVDKIYDEIVAMEE